MKNAGDFKKKLEKNCWSTLKARDRVWEGKACGLMLLISEVGEWILLVKSSLCLAFDS